MARKSGSRVKPAYMGSWSTGDKGHVDRWQGAATEKYEDQAGKAVEGQFPFQFPQLRPVTSLEELIQRVTHAVNEFKMTPAEVLEPANTALRNRAAKAEEKQRAIRRETQARIQSGDVDLSEEQLEKMLAAKRAAKQEKKSA
jgi:hypothetical protein